MIEEQPEVEDRHEEYASRIVTRIWSEQASKRNPYLTERCLCRGYDLFELMEKRGFVDMIYLLFRGELPTREQARLLETLMIAFVNPGPRHPATRAAMVAGIGKSDTAHILPVSLSVLGSKHLGGGEVKSSMLFLNKHMKSAPDKIAADMLNNTDPPKKGDWHIAPGFGSRFGGIDPLPKAVAEKVISLPGSGKALQWGMGFAEALETKNQGWLSTGVCAAAFIDLGFISRAGAGLFQLISAPGLLAHGVEMSNKPRSAMPFIDQEHYIIEPEARKK